MELENIKTNSIKSDEIKYLARNAVRDIINSTDIHTEIISQREIDRLLKKYNFLSNINDHRIICEAEILARQEEAEKRKEKINQKIKEEEEKRNEIRIKAAEFMTEFNQKRKEEIAKRRKMLEEREQKKSEENKQEDAWSNVKSNIDLKDSEYKGSKDVQRMREAMMNNPNSQPMQNIFG